MADRTRRYSGDVPCDIEGRLRERCLSLPDAYEERAWVGTRWMVRKRTFAHVLGIADGGAEPEVVVTFRSAGVELEALRRAGPPYLALGWGRDAMGLVLDDATDWAEALATARSGNCGKVIMDWSH